MILLLLLLLLFVTVVIVVVVVVVCFFSVAILAQAITLEGVVLYCTSTRHLSYSPAWPHSGRINLNTVLLSELNFQLQPRVPRPGPSWFEVNSFRAH